MTLHRNIQSFAAIFQRAKLLMMVEI